MRKLLYFQSQVFQLPFKFVKSTGFKFFAKIMGGNYAFIAQVILALNSTSRIKIKILTTNKQDLEGKYFSVVKHRLQ